MHASAFQNVCSLRYCMSGFLEKTPKYEGKLHTLHLLGEKTSKENGNQGVDYIPKRNVLLNRN